MKQITAVIVATIALLLILRPRRRYIDASIRHD